MFDLDNKTTYQVAIDCKYVGQDNGNSTIGILMHGFGSCAENLMPLAVELSKAVPYWIIPQAPIRMTDIMDFPSFAWFPNNTQEIQEALFGHYWHKISVLDPPDLPIVAKKLIHELIIPLIEKNPQRKIVLTGFSQGGMVTSEIALQCMIQNIEIHKLVLFSSCLISSQRWTNIAKKYILNKISKVVVPTIYQSHGSNDLVLTITNGLNLLEFWKQYTSIDFHKFTGAHEIPHSAVEQAVAFLIKRKVL